MSIKPSTFLEACLIASTLVIASAGCGTTGAKIGAVCSSDSDCGGKRYCDKTVPGGQCTLACDDDGDCGEGNLCGVAAICVKGCAQNGDCRQGFVCTGAAAGGRYCLPSAEADASVAADAGVADAAGDGPRPDLAHQPIGTACKTDTDCGGKFHCDTRTPGGQCTRNCDDDGDCGAGGFCGGAACVAAWGDCATNPRLCVKWCARADDCRNGYQCSGVSAAGSATDGGTYCQP
jgi:hypothetical protein